jgi:hypothetical protein
MPVQPGMESSCIPGLPIQKARWEGWFRRDVESKLICRMPSISGDFARMIRFALNIGQIVYRRSVFFMGLHVTVAC